MEIPESFDFMTDDIARIKYPSELRPHVIFTNEDASVDYKFSYVNQTLDEGLLDELIKQTKLNLRKIYTGIQFYDKDIFQVDGTKLGWFEFMSPAIDGSLYNIVFYTWINGQLLQGGFNCIYEDSVSWRPIVINSLRTIRKETVI